MRIVLSLPPGDVIHVEGGAEIAPLLDRLAEHARGVDGVGVLRQLDSRLCLHSADRDALADRVEAWLRRQGANVERDVWR